MEGVTLESPDRVRGSSQGNFGTLLVCALYNFIFLCNPNKNDYANLTCVGTVVDWVAVLVWAGRLLRPQSENTPSGELDVIMPSYPDSLQDQFPNQ
eukprot:5723384-Amphidinium_carterae.2